MRTYVQYQKFQWLRDQLEKEGVNIPLPSGNWLPGSCSGGGHPFY